VGLFQGREDPDSAFPQCRLQSGSHALDNLAPNTLGDRVCISQGAYLCTGNHDFRSPGFDLRLGPIAIGSDTWIAARAVLTPGPTESLSRVGWCGHAGAGFVGTALVLWPTPLPLLI
jgi:putative colanic acid biosynthesis acetyltransferase WcaF